MRWPTIPRCFELSFWNYQWSRCFIVQRLFKFKIRRKRFNENPRWIPMQELGGKIQVYLGNIFNYIIIISLNTISIIIFILKKSYSSLPSCEISCPSKCKKDKDSYKCTWYIASRFIYYSSNAPIEIFENLFKQYQTPTELNRAAYEATYRQTGNATEFEFCTDPLTGTSCAILSYVISKSGFFINKVTKKTFFAHIKNTSWIKIILFNLVLLRIDKCFLCKFNKNKQLVISKNYKYNISLSIIYVYMYVFKYIL